MNKPSHDRIRVAIAIELHWNLPWHLDTFQGIMDYGKGRGWECVADPYLDGVAGDDDLAYYDGVVGRLDREASKSVKQLDLPAVNLMRMKPDEQHPPSVSVDPFSKQKMAAEHLLAAGYQRLGYVGNSQYLDAHNQRLLEDYSSTITAQGGSPPTCHWVNDDDLASPANSKACRQALTEWIKAQDKPIGVFVEMCTVGRQFAQICTQLGLDIPGQVGLLLGDADAQTMTSMSPTLSAIEIDYYKQGQEAAEMLDQLMQGKAVSLRIKTVSPTRVIVRESTDVFLCDDKLVTQAMRYIAEHSREALRVDRVAEALHVSRRTLDRRFEEAIGKTVSQEIQRLRLQQIENLLLGTDHSMSKVAEMCGFGSASHFSEFFSKNMGVSPSTFRKSQQRNS